MIFSIADLRKLLIQSLRNHEDLLRMFLATISYSGIDPLEVPAILELSESQKIRDLAKKNLAPVIAAIEAQDSEAANEALLNMKTPPRIM